MFHRGRVLELHGQANRWPLNLPRIHVWRDGNIDGSGYIGVTLELGNGSSDPVLALDVIVNDPRRPRAR